MPLRNPHQGLRKMGWAAGWGPFNYDGVRTPAKCSLSPPAIAIPLPTTWTLRGPLHVQDAYEQIG
jgi:hypothetical protein